MPSASKDQLRLLEDRAQYIINDLSECYRRTAFGNYLPPNPMAMLDAISKTVTLLRDVVAELRK